MLIRLVIRYEYIKLTKKFLDESADHSELVKRKSTTSNPPSFSKTLVKTKPIILKPRLIVAGKKRANWDLILGIA